MSILTILQLTATKICSNKTIISVSCHEVLLLKNEKIWSKSVFHSLTTDLRCLDIFQNCWSNNFQKFTLARPSQNWCKSNETWKQWQRIFYLLASESMMFTDQSLRTIVTRMLSNFVHVSSPTSRSRNSRFASYAQTVITVSGDESRWPPARLYLTPATFYVSN